ncbi:hypothetical protein MTR_7g085445 [Medicago truncatula]|uniref:Uncharacterized protein n=1 Tax=Medicago truncatula TaxID=3880 RepID=A0A072UCE4_MEDTR|nr:hypothetical protein MTR_7g085445 [Medicago truncatula]
MAKYLSDRPYPLLLNLMGRLSHRGSSYKLHNKINLWFELGHQKANNLKLKSSDTFDPKEYKFSLPITSLLDPNSHLSQMHDESSTKIQSTLN